MHAAIGTPLAHTGLRSPQLALPILGAQRIVKYRGKCRVARERTHEGVATAASAGLGVPTTPATSAYETDLNALSP